MPLLANRDIVAEGGSTRKSSKNHIIEQYQEMDDLNKVTQKLASEMRGKSKLPSCA
jgi:hypothetical protein